LAADDLPDFADTIPFFVPVLTNQAFLAEQ